MLIAVGSGWTVGAENDVSNHAPVIAFEEYQYHAFCTKHKSLQKNDNGTAPSFCAACREIKNDEESNEATGKFIRKI